MAGRPLLVSSAKKSGTISYSLLAAAALSLLFITNNNDTNISTMSGFASAKVVSKVPERMQISPIMKNTKEWLLKAQLIPLDFSKANSISKTITGEKNDTPVVKEKDMILKGNEVVQRHMGPNGSIAFVVRRPGWVLCREHGQQLTDLATTANSDTKTISTGLNGFQLFGIVKETGVDDAGLTDFYQENFPYPIYRDTNLDFYQSFGKNAKITDNLSWSMMLNPLKMYRGMKDMTARMESKKLKGNLIGEGMKTGGIIIFGTDGQPKYAYPEITGSELVIEELLLAVQAVRDNNNNIKMNDDSGGNEL